MSSTSPASIRAVRALHWAPMALALAGASYAEGAAASGTVRVLETPRLDWPEGRRAIEAELVAAGYEIEKAAMDAPDEAALLRELLVTDGGDRVASVTVVRAGATGVAYARFAGSDETYSVASNDPDPSRAAEILSLRLIELLAIRGDERARPPTPPPPAARRESQPLPAAPPPVPVWFLLGGAGAGWTSDFDAPSVDVTLALERRLTARFRLEGHARIGVLAAERSFPRGTVSVANRSFAAGVLAWFGPEGASASGPFASIGPRFGADCYEIRGSDVGATLVCSAAVSVASRVGLGLGRWSIGLAAEGAFALQQIRLLDEVDVLATLGRPRGNVGLEAGWSF